MENSRFNKRWLHQVANQVMGLNGVLTLLRIGKLSFDREQLEKLEHNAAALMQLIEEARTEMVKASSKLNDGNAYEITYLSRLQDVFTSTSQHVVADIREVSQRNNSEQGITGCLLYFRGYFLQRLEGPEHALLRLLGKIMLDPRHAQVTLLSSGPLTMRSHRRWQAMQCTSVQDDDELAAMLQQLITRSHHQLGSAESQALVNLMLENMQRSGIDLQQ